MNFALVDEQTMKIPINSRQKSTFKILPDYQKLVDTIKAKIAIGELKPGDSIRSENFLSAEFDLNRLSVKKALALLENEGYIFSISGKGKYVGQNNSNHYELFFDELLILGEKYEEVKIIEVNVIRPNHEVCEHLKLQNNKFVVRIKRVYLNENRIKIFEITYVPYYRGMPVVEREINYSEFPEKVMAKKKMNTISKKLSIKAGVAKGALSKIFEIEDGEAVLIVEQKKFDENNNPLIWTRLFFYGEVNGLSAVASF